MISKKSGFMPAHSRAGLANTKSRKSFSVNRGCPGAFQFPLPPVVQSFGIFLGAVETPSLGYTLEFSFDHLSAVPARQIIVHFAIQVGGVVVLHPMAIALNPMTD